MCVQFIAALDIRVSGCSGLCLRKAFDLRKDIGALAEVDSKDVDCDTRPKAVRRCNGT